MGRISAMKFEKGAEEPAYVGTSGTISGADANTSQTEGLYDEPAFHRTQKVNPVYDGETAQDPGYLLTSTVDDAGYLDTLPMGQPGDTSTDGFVLAEAGETEEPAYVDSKTLTSRALGVDNSQYDSTTEEALYDSADRSLYDHTGPVAEHEPAYNGVLTFGAAPPGESDYDQTGPTAGDDPYGFGAEPVVVTDDGGFLDENPSYDQASGQQVYQMLEDEPIMDVE